MSKQYNISITKMGEQFELDYLLPEGSTDALVILQLLNTRIKSELDKLCISHEGAWDLVSKRDTLKAKVSFNIPAATKNLSSLKLNVDLSKQSKTSLALLYMAVIELLTA